MKDKILVPAFLLGLLIISGCDTPNTSELKKYREKKLLMGTFIQLDVCQSERDASKRDIAFQDIWSRLIEIDQWMSSYNDTSDVAHINSSQGAPVKVKRDTYHVLERSLHFYRKTNGAFDITVWPLIQLWQNSEQSNTLPDPQTIEMTRSAVGMHLMELNQDHTVKLKNPSTKIDLGGIAKGYAVDEAARLFRQHGFLDFYIDAGGDIYAGGQNCEGRDWRIGIRDPRDFMEITEIVAVSDRAVMTSGNYEQNYTIQDQQWSHIMDPRTGYPQKVVVSATVISPSAMDADALATALTVLDPQAGNELINSMGLEYASMVIIKDGQNDIQKTPNRSYSTYLSDSYK